MYICIYVELSSNTNSSSATFTHFLMHKLILFPFFFVPCISAQRSQRGEIFSIQFFVHHEQPPVDSICGLVGRAFA